MSNEAFISKDQFTFIVQPPVNRQNIKTVTVYADERFTLNAKLTEIITGKSICVRFTPDARHLCLEESDPVHATYKVSKIGSRKIKQIKEFLVKNKIALPAKYNVFFNEKENFWQGDLIPNPTIQNTGRRKDSKKN